MGRRVVLLALIVIAASLWPAAAFGNAEGSLINGVMIYTDTDNEVNNVVFTVSDTGEPTYRITDSPDVFITANSPCFKPVTGADNVMECPQDGNGSGAITLLQASLGDGNDSISLQVDLPTSIGAGGGADQMNGGPGADFLRGGQGNDTITGGAGADQLVGDDPNVVGGGADLMDGGTGDDTVDGQDGNDTVSGGDGNDVLSGSGGDDALLADDGQDDLNGGDGIDLADYSARSAPQQLSNDGLRNDGQNTFADNIGTDVENLAGGSGDDAITGNGVANVLFGNAGSDTISAAGGDDQVIAADGADTASGGDGNDSVLGGSGDDRLDGDAGNDSLNGGNDNDSLGGGAGNDQLAGEAGFDSLRGDAGEDTLSGGDLDDFLGGGDGNDQLNGDAGNDSLDGGTGADVYSGGDGSDTADYLTRISNLTVTLDDNAGDGEFGENDNVKADVENVLGGSGADTFIGNGSANTLNGGGGEDYEDGGAGSDSLLGGENGDVLRTRGGSAQSTIDCGGGPDFVIAKPGDIVRSGCDRVDRGVNQKPKLRDSAVVTPANGSLQMSPAGIVRRVPLQDKVVLPLRSIVDTVAGAVKVTSAATSRKSQTIALEDGAFDITQNASKLATTQFALQGGDFSVCPVSARRKKGARSAATGKTKVVRVLWANGKGKFRTKGKYATAAIRGTRWQTVDRCDGTLIRVTRGAVSVLDLVKRKTVLVRAGDSYLAAR